MVIPSPYEEHTGEVRSPVGCEVEIQQATDTLNAFVADFQTGRIPAVSLDQLSSAADLLWTYAGCPSEDVWGVMFFESPEAAASYRGVANAMPHFVDKMSALIEARRITVLGDGFAMNDDDVPF
jgi:hypothetical protein